MQLPITGHPLHTRSLTIVLTHLDTGRVRARGVVNDLRKCGFVPMNYGIQPAGLIHQMSIDLTLDAESQRIESLEVDQPFVAVEVSEGTKGECCRDPAVHLDALVGECIDAEFPKKLSAVFGGPRGCSHLLTLFQLMASAVPRAFAREGRLVGELGVGRAPGERLFWRSCFLDGFESESGGIELAVQLHDFHGRPQVGNAGPLDRFERHDEVRVFARVGTPGFEFEAFQAAERIRERTTLARAEWRSRDDEVAGFVGTLVIPGLAGRIFERFGDDPKSEVLRDALLQLAPGQIQVMAAITDRWFVEASEAKARGGQNIAKAVMDAAKGPPVGAIGGMVDSCWMWRSDGALAETRFRSPDEQGG